MEADEEEESVSSMDTVVLGPGVDNPDEVLGSGGQHFPLGQARLPGCEVLIDGPRRTQEAGDRLCFSPGSPRHTHLRGSLWVSSSRTWKVLLANTVLLICRFPQALAKRAWKGSQRKTTVLAGDKYGSHRRAGGDSLPP